MIIFSRKRFTVQFVLACGAIICLLYMTKRLQDLWTREYKQKTDNEYVNSKNQYKASTYPKNIPLIQLFGPWNRPSISCSKPCKLSTGKKLLSKADAVVFYPNDRRIKTLKLKRKDRQIWIFYMLESPHIPFFATFSNSEVYNWTITYRHDSDIVSRYYGHYHLKKGVKITPEVLEGLSNHSLPVPPEKLDKFREKYLKGRTKLMAWTSSHKKCESEGGREAMVRLLDEALGVDKFGACGPNKCKKDRGDISNIPSCYQQQSKEYKFYLSFENSICKDYVTEKLFHPLNKGMVPIGYAGVDYSRHAPPGSYIDSLSFPNVSALIDHIKFLDKNPEEYLKYFLWTEYYEILWPIPVQWCTLCEKLWSISVVDKQGHRKIDPSYSKVHRNISSWFSYRLGSDDEEGTFNPKWVPACLPAPKLK